MQAAQCVVIGTSEAFIKAFERFFDILLLTFIAAIFVVISGFTLCKFTKKSGDVEKIKKKDISEWKRLLRIAGLAVLTFSVTPPIVITLVLYFILFLPFTGYLSGSEHGQKERASYESCNYEGTSKIACTYLLNSENEIIGKGLLVTASSNSIALYDNGAVTRFPIDGRVIKTVGPTNVEE